MTISLNSYDYVFRATEADIMDLFTWASSGHDLTLNQRIKPGLIIIVNKDRQDPGTNARWLDPDYATRTLLSQLELSPVFRELRNKWVAQEKILRTAEDLILCYYDSFWVLFIPNLGLRTARLIAKQYRTLYSKIRQSSKHLREKRMKVGMKLDVVSFDVYIEEALNRLAKGINSQIDFYYLANRESAMPSKFSEHLTALIARLWIKEGYDLSTGDRNEEVLLARLTPYLASCIASQMPSTIDLYGWYSILLLALMGKGFGTLRSVSNDHCRKADIH